MQAVAKAAAADAGSAVAAELCCCSWAGHGCRFGSSVDKNNTPLIVNGARVCAYVQHVATNISKYVFEVGIMSKRVAAEAMYENLYGG